MLAGFEVAEGDLPAFRAFLDELGYPYTPSTTTPPANFRVGRVLFFDSPGSRTVTGYAVATHTTSQLSPSQSLTRMPPGAEAAGMKRQTCPWKGTPRDVVHRQRNTAATIRDREAANLTKDSARLRARSRQCVAVLMPPENLFAALVEQPLESQMSSARLKSVDEEFVDERARVGADITGEIRQAANRR